MRTHRPRVTIVSLHFAPEPTGNAPYAAALASGLAAGGAEVRVLTTHPHYPGWLTWPGYGGWVHREEHGDVKITRLRHYVPSRPAGMRRVLGELSFGVRAAVRPWGRPDVVLTLSPGLFASLPVAVRARLSPRRQVLAVWVQDIYSSGIRETSGGSKRAAAIVSTIEATFLRWADGVAVIHNRFARQLIETLGVKRSRVEVIRNWAHVQVRHDIGTATRRELHGWDGAIVALHAGNMGVKQGLENVVDAARVADSRPEPIKFVLMGDGNQRPALEDRASGIESIEFMDPVPDEEFMAVLTSADVLVVNERSELREMSVPSKLTSYFSTGRPVVAATDQDSVTAHEVATSGGGWRVDPGDPVALVDAVIAVASDPALSTRLGQAGLAYRDAILSEDAAITHYAEWLASLVEQKRQHCRPRAGGRR